MKVSLALLLLALLPCCFGLRVTTLYRRSNKGTNRNCSTASGPRRGQRIFGEKILAFDPAAVAKVKTMRPGERLKLDTDGDGKIDTVYFIDDDPKNQAEFRPLS